MAMLGDLPAELIDAIVAQLPSDQHVNSLARTSRHFYLMVNPTLYHRKPYVLSWSAEKGRISTAQLALDSCPDLDIDQAASCNGFESVLSLAAKNGHAQMVEWLLDKEIIDANHRDVVSGCTALLHAVGEGHCQVVTVLLSQPNIDVNLQGTAFPYSPLTLAAENGNEEMMKLLMQTSAIDLDARDESDRTPLMYAAESGHISIVKLLLDTGRVKDGSDQASYVPPAAWSVAESIVFYGYRDQVEVLKMLLNEPSLNADYRSENGETLLIWAARQGQLEIVELILECGKYDITAVNHAGRSAFSSAAGTSLLVMQCLYRTGQVDINQPDTMPGCSPVWVAVEANYRWSLEWLLSHDDVDVTRRDRSGYTLLEYAVTNDLPDMMSALLASPKVDPNTRNKHGETPLHRAAIQGNDKLVKRLVDSEKVDVNAGDKRGRTPVSWAVEMGANAVLKALLSSGRADIRVADLNGVTPLALAKRNRSSVCVQLMWNSGQLDCRLEYDGETEPRRPVDFQAQEYIDTYLTDARLDWPSTSRG